jgi:hypothetical protein
MARLNESTDGQQRWITWQDVIFVEAVGQPTATNLREFETWFRGYAAAHPHGVGLIIELRTDIPPPDEAGKKTVRELLGRMEPQLRALGYVIEAPGFGAATLRAVLAGMNLVQRRSYLQVTARSVDEALAAILPRLHGGRARAAGLRGATDAILQARAGG